MIRNRIAREGVDYSEFMMRPGLVQMHSEVNDWPGSCIYEERQAVETAELVLGNVLLSMVQMVHNGLHLYK